MNTVYMNTHAMHMQLTVVVGGGNWTLYIALREPLEGR